MSSRDGDLRSPIETDALFSWHRPTHVIHLAALVGGLFRNLHHNVEFWNDNVAINTNVLECCHRYGVKKLVSCLSTCIFPDRVERYPIDETMLHAGPPHASNEGYSYAKRMLEMASRCYRRQYGSNFVTVIPTNVYGPHDNFHLEHSHVIPALIRKADDAKRNATDLVVWGSGTPLRQFIYSHDLARLMIWTLHHYDDSDPVILSVDPQDEISIRDVVYTIADAMDLPHDRIVFDDSKSDGQYKKTASNEKLRSLLPEDFRFTRFQQGIVETVCWFQANRQTARV